MPATPEWVIVRRSSDPIAAEMTLDFLREHGIHVRMEGSTGLTAVVNAYGVVPDIRLAVPAEEATAAYEALAALASARAVAVPGDEDFAPGFDDPDEEAESSNDPRAPARPQAIETYRGSLETPLAAPPPRTRGDILRAAMVPFGGAHFSVGQPIAASIYGTALLVSVVLYAGAWLPTAPLAIPALMVLDGLLALRGLEAYNRGEPTSARAQIVEAALAVAVVLGTAAAIAPR